MKPNIDVSSFNSHQVPYDFRRDLFLLVQYFTNNEVKRTVYGNMLTKSDYKKICKYLKRPELMDEYEKEIGIWWIDYLDRLALNLDWISYDTEGVYQGYSSTSAAFQDNYIKVNEEKVSVFLKLTALEQEKYLFRHLKEEAKKSNEWMSRSHFTRLDRFDTWGSGTGVLPTLDLNPSRSLLIQILGELTPNVWYATADLIELMKQQHKWFLIPKKVYVEEPDGWNKPKKKVKYPRYSNFYEGDRYSSSNRKPIPDNDPLGFEKVEGRFIERFLESFLFEMGYIEVAYKKEPYKGKAPSMGLLAAFKLSPIFFTVLQNTPVEVKVTIQPNFEIYIDSPIYPTAMLSALFPFADTLKEDKQHILKLNKQRVLNYLVDNSDFNIIDFLEKLSDTPLPQNLVMELKEWTERTDVFTLYDGYGIYEGLKKQAIADIHTEATITPKIRLVRKPKVLFEKLRKQKVIPMLVRHKDANFQLLPLQAKSVFPKQNTVKPKKATKQKIEIKRQELLTYTLPNQKIYDVLLTALIKAHFQVEASKEKKTFTFLKTEEAQIKKILEGIKDMYQVSIKKI